MFSGKWYIAGPVGLTRNIVIPVRTLNTATKVIANTFTLLPFLLAVFFLAILSNLAYDKGFMYLTKHAETDKKDFYGNYTVDKDNRDNTSEINLLFSCSTCYRLRYICLAIFHIRL